MIITLAGNAGSGKSTVGKLLANKLSWQRYSMGDVRAKMAEDKGMTIDELNKLGEESEETDIPVDNYARELGEKEDDFVMDGWIAWNFIPHSLKVFLTVDEDEGARRIFEHRKEGGRTDEPAYETIEQTKQTVRARVASNAARYKKYYDIRWDDVDKMDLVIDTTNLTPEQVVEQIVDRIESKR